MTQDHTLSNATLPPTMVAATLNLSDLLTPEQAALTLKLSVKTLATWRSTGRHALPFIRCGSRIRYHRPDLVAWLASRQGTGQACAAKGAA